MGDRPSPSPQFIVAQLGARMHYAVPRLLERSGMLETFYTDLCINKGSTRGILRLIPKAIRPAGIRRLAGRDVADVPLEKIRPFSAFGWEYARRHRIARTPSQRTAMHLWAGRTFPRLVLKAGFGEARGVYTFNSAGLAVLTEARKRGLLAVTEQTIAPRAVEERILAAEHDRWPGWEPDERDEFAAEYAALEQAEWSEADVILCGSEFVREGIGRVGGPVKRCCIVPYGVSLPAQPPADRASKAHCRALFLGAIGLRKGIQYVAETARVLGPNRLQFRAVGPVSLTDQGMDRVAASVEIVPGVPRAEVYREFREAAIFVLPSLCEGSATVIYEAMASGLPVVTTPNSGSIVRDGVEGFIVPPADVQRLAEALDRLAGDPELRLEMGRAARRRAETFGGLSHYGERLIDALRPGVAVSSPAAMPYAR